MTIKNHLILSLKIERAEYVHLYQVGMKKILRDAFYTVFYGEGRRVRVFRGIKMRFEASTY